MKGNDDGQELRIRRRGTTIYPVLLCVGFVVFGILVYAITIGIKSMPASQASTTPKDVRGQLGGLNNMPDYPLDGIVPELKPKKRAEVVVRSPAAEAPEVRLNPVGIEVGEIEARGSKLTVYSAGRLPDRTRIMGAKQSSPSGRRGSLSQDARSTRMVTANSEDPNQQQAKVAFAFQGREDFISLKAVRKAPEKHHILSVGTLIPALMKEAINSDLPGELRAQVSHNVYDSPTGETLLIPQGSTLFGRYESKVSYGQSRVLVVWHLLTFPDGSTLNLAAMEGADSAGVAGFHDQVNNHYWKIFGSAALLSVISAGAQLSQPQNSVLENQSVGSTAAAALGQNLTAVGNNLIQRNLNIQPTLEIRAGYRFVVKVNKQLSFGGI